MIYLRPRNDSQYLPVAEIVTRATHEFRFVHCDDTRGLRYVTERILRSGAGLSHDDKAQALALVADTIEMVAGNHQHSDTDFIKCYVIPNEPLVVEFLYAGHAERAEPLLVRLCSALGYEIYR